MSEELKPCPFCGRPGKIGTKDDVQTEHVVFCIDYAKNCGAEVVGWPTEEKAIKAWNKRA